MSINLDYTKLKIPVKKHDNCTVISVGSGAFPRYIEVRMTGVDGARRTAVWDGLLNLANSDTVICEEYPGNPILRIVGFGGGHDASVNTVRVTQIWESDLGAIAAEANAGGDVTFHNDVLLDGASKKVAGSGGNKPTLGAAGERWGSIFVASGEEIDGAGTLAINAATLLTINADGADSDTVIEGDNDTALFYVDAGQDFIGIGISTPDSKLNLDETYTASSSHAAFRLNQTWSPSTTSGSQFPVVYYLGPTYDTTHSPSGGFMSGQRIFGTFANSGTLNWRGLDMVLNNTGAGTISSAEDIRIRTAVNSGGGAITTYRAIRIENQTAAGTNYGLYVQGTGVLNFFQGDVRIGSDTSGAKLYVDQEDSSGAIPALYLKQQDVSEEMIEFDCTIGVGNAIEAVGAKTLTPTHFVKVTLPGGLTRYFEVGTIA